MQKNRIINRGVQISEFVVAPSQTSFVGTTIVLSVVAVPSIASAIPAATGKWTLAVLAGLLSLAIIHRAVYAVHAALLVLLLLSLVGWVILTKPDIKHNLALVPELPFWVYPFAGIGFAIFNSAMEELYFVAYLWKHSIVH
jgi:hypothetical protein